MFIFVCWGFCRCLCLKWCSEIANTLQTSQHVYLTNEFGELLKSLIWLGKLSFFFKLVASILNLFVFGSYQML